MSSQKTCTVAFIISGSFLGGAEQQFQYLVTRLPKHGIDLSVTCFFDKPLMPLLQAAGVPTHLVRRTSRKTWQDPQRALRLAAHLRRLRPDIVHTWLFEGNVYGAAAAWLAGYGRKLLVSERGTDVPTDRPGTALLHRQTCRIARGVVVNSHAGVQFLEQEGISPSKLHFVPNGLPPERVCVTMGREIVRSKLGIPDDAPTFISVARLQPQKDHHTLLHAFAKFHRDDNPVAHLLLVGRGALEEELRRKCAALGIADVVHFAGEQREPASFMAASDVAVLSSLGGEGQSNFLIEALLVGLPVVATTVGGNREVVAGTDAVLVPPRTPAAFAEGMRRALLLGTDDAHRRLRQQAVNRFDIEASTAQLARIYHDIVSQR